MRQLVIPRHGPPEVMRLREVPDPEPGAGQVRIRVRAAGLNFADVMARQGLYPDAPPLPAVMGYEVAGEIDRVGPGVSGRAAGERVIGLTRFGGHGELVVVPESRAVPLPDGWTFAGIGRATAANSSWKSQAPLQVFSTDWSSTARLS